MCVYESVCGDKKEREREPVKVRLDFYFGGLREDLFFLPVCACDVKISIKLRGESTRRERQGVNQRTRGWPEASLCCVCVCDTPVFSESIRPLALSTNI